MDALKKAMLEYRKRINDPSYVAPDILRNKNRQPVDIKPGLPRNNDPVEIVRAEEVMRMSDPDSVVREGEYDDEIKKQMLRKMMGY